MNIIKGSFVYKIINKFLSGLSKGIKNSYIYEILTKNVDKRKSFNDSVFVKAIYWIINLVRKIFCFLRLDKVFDGSIFAKPYLWVGLTVALAPILSTLPMVALAIVCILSLMIKICLNKDFKFRYSPVDFWVLIFLIVYACSALTSLTMMSSLKIAAVVLVFILMYFVVINSIETKKQLNIMIYILVLIGMLVSIYGIAQYFSEGIITISWLDSNLFENKTRVYSTFDNPNVLGEYLLLVIPMAVSMLFASKGVFKKVMMVGILGIMFVCLALTYSRGCYLGIIFAAVVFALLLSIKFILLLIAGGVALPFVLPQSIIDRFTSITNLSDTSTSYRLSIWISSLEIIKKYWYRPIGQGAEAFNKVFPLFAQREVGSQHAHNLYLQVTIESGIIAIISLIMLIYRFIQYMLNGIKNAISFVDRVYLIGFVSGISGFMLQSIFDNTWYNYRIVLVFWIFLGLGVRKKIFVEEEKMLDDKSSQCN